MKHLLLALLLCLPLAASPSDAQDVTVQRVPAPGGVVDTRLAGLIIGFSIRFRSGSKVTRHKVSRLVHREIEIGWIAATAIVALFFFWWTTSANLQQAGAPAGAMEIHIEAKQWMWKAGHPDGTRELSTLHVPADQPVTLYLNSQELVAYIRSLKGDVP